MSDKNGIVEVGYNSKGQGIIFVAEWHEKGDQNILTFSSKGLLLDDRMLDRLIWAPILPVSETPSAT